MLNAVRGQSGTQTGPGIMGLRDQHACHSGTLPPSVIKLDLRIVFLLRITQKPVQTRNVSEMFLCATQASMRTLPNSKLSRTLPVKLLVGPRDTTM